MPAPSCWDPLLPLSAAAALQCDSRHSRRSELGALGWAPDCRCSNCNPVACWLCDSDKLPNFSVLQFACLSPRRGNGILTPRVW